MTQRHWLVWCLQLGRVGLLGWIGAIAFASSTFAQSRIVPDRTLNAESSIVTPNVQGLPRVEITGGAIRGANLFHSFQEFNVDAGRGAYFLNPNASIKNIFTRVTGNNPSEIYGTLGTIGNAANLFLMNPNGIIFGPNAALNVSGSFVGTTANAIQFGNLGIFSASTPNAPGPLLTINPSALLFNQLPIDNITNSSQASAGVSPIGNNVNGLRVPDGNSLLLVGGNVKLDGGNLIAYGGRVELAGLAAPGSVGLNVAGNTFSLSVPNDAQRADVSLTNARIGVVGAGGGDIAINARNLEISNSLLFGGIETGLGNVDTVAGDIKLNATDSVLIENSDILNNIQAGSVGKGGDILITAGTLDLNGAQLQSSILGANASVPGGRGNAGSVNINVRDRVTLSGVNQNGNTDAIFTDVDSGAVGKGGDISITTGSLSLTNGAQLLTGTSGQGNAGNVFINARDITAIFR